MIERDKKTGRFKNVPDDNSMILSAPNIHSIVRFTIHEFMIEQMKTKKPDEDTSMKEVDFTMSIIMKACASLMLFFAAVFLAVRLWT